MLRPVVLWLVSVLTAVLAFGCEDPVTIRIVVEPKTVSVGRGETVMVTASFTVDGVAEPGGDGLAWVSEIPSIAQVSSGPGGTASITGVTNGSTTIAVRGRGLKTEVRVTVITPGPVSLVIDPASVNVPAGLQTQLTANARLADSSMVNVSGQATWTTSQPSVASVDNLGEVTTHTTGTAIITAELDGLSAIAAVNVTSARLTAITITPPAPTVPLGLTAALTAMGTFTDGTLRDVSQQVTWSSQFPAVADISLIGIVHGNLQGATLISATMGNVLGTTTLTVTAPELVSIAVTPVAPTRAVGQTLDFVATGTMSDGATAVITSMVTWTSTTPAIATVSDVAGTKGRATMVAAGNTTIRATLGMVANQTTLTVAPPVLVSIAVAPAAVAVPLGRPQQFTATGTMSDGMMVNLTTTAMWTTVNPAIATISNVAGSQGRATMVALGTTVVRATSGMVTGTATLVVSGPALDSITIAPANGMVAIGANRALRADGHFSDGSTVDISGLVTRASSVPARATIDAAGVAHGVSVGATMIAAQQGMVSGATMLTVTPAELLSIAVTPPAPTVIAGQPQQFTATGTYTDLTTLDLTATAMWASSNQGVATVANVAGSQGLATTLAGGTTSITATVGMVVGTTPLTSTATTVAAIVPADGATAIRTTTPIIVTFTQAMQPVSLSTQISAGPCAGAIQLSRDGFASCLAFTTTMPVMSVGDTVATLIPAAALRSLARYRIRVTTAATAASGIAMAAPVAQVAGFVTASDGECAAEVVISQIYGGGGNTGAPILHDFIELHNPGPTPVDLGGKAVQYTSAAGTGTWIAQALPAVTIAPGGYYLIREAAGAGAQPALADPDFIPMVPIALAATAGKVALTPTATPLVGGCPLAFTLDLVGYGATATCYEGAAPVAAPANATAVTRAAAGCTDRNLAADFAVVAPAPRNALTMAQVCVCYVTDTDLESEIDYCNLQFPTVLTGAAPLVINGVFGRVFEAGVTEAAGASPKVRMAVGGGANGSAPQSWTWLDAAFNVSVGNDDEYVAPLTFAAPGEYDFTTRATRDGTNWTLCDIDGAGANPFLFFDQAQTGAATVTP